METNNHYFYVLECADGSYYAGYTNDLQKRLEAHNAGKGAKYTRAKGPVEMIHHESFETKSAAMKAEYAFKQLSKPQKMHYIAEGKEDGK
ncbi:GIY-YIG nuclease family protein [Planococcus liqunii]|uniref:GIY-YIG nuclease family protein n=1 Tax=Planococcus liqunii TaxID=3058394 RepID=A0ABT8MWQ9_9BACL|nr:MULTISPECIES: GIY-YIG nuclease family protein [unclassified Planococcus (in: firmicutes)]MDN7229357.1 GIY-YIG nuclease family protein [Planococcus sp. N064]WKA51085.1 GIY-YIG nuclease family protein [Planococcus sp. N056]